MVGDGTILYMDSKAKPKVHLGQGVEVPNFLWDWGGQSLQRGGDTQQMFDCRGGLAQQEGEIPAGYHQQG